MRPRKKGYHKNSGDALNKGPRAHQCSPKTERPRHGVHAGDAAALAAERCDATHASDARTQRTSASGSRSTAPAQSCAKARAAIIDTPVAASSRTLHSSRISRSSGDPRGEDSRGGAPARGSHAAASPDDKASGAWCLRHFALEAHHRTSQADARAYVLAQIHVKICEQSPLVRSWEVSERMGRGARGLEVRK